MFYCTLLYLPLYHLFSPSLSKHVIPNEWRIHMIRPIPKSGDKSKVLNYRPISLLCTTLKVLEHLIYSKSINFIIRSISSSQFGFLPKRSALQQPLTMTNYIYKSFDLQNSADCIYLDFRKSFGSVPHKKLLLNSGLWGSMVDYGSGLVLT